MLITSKDVIYYHVLPSGEGNRDEYCGESYPRPSPHIHDRLCSVKLIFPKERLGECAALFGVHAHFSPFPSTPTPSVFCVPDALTARKSPKKP